VVCYAGPNENREARQCASQAGPAMREIYADFNNFAADGSLDLTWEGRSDGHWEFLRETGPAC